MYLGVKNFLNGIRIILSLMEFVYWLVGFVKVWVLEIFFGCMIEDVNCVVMIIGEGYSGFYCNLN